jgi:glycosyltransferase involved in cell wall biosynthesis
MRIGIYGEMFVEWGGGIDFLRLISKGLHAMPHASENQLFLIVPIKKTTPWSQTKYLVKKTWNLLPFKKKFVAVLPKPLNLPQIKDTLSKEAKMEVLLISSSIDQLGDTLAPYQLDVLLPCFHPLPADFPIPWIGYLYDFQHKYLPQFFTAEEIAQRDLAFAQMVQQSRAIIVNARAVKSDAIKFLNAPDDKIFALPFCPLYGQEIVEGSIAHFQLPPKFFLVSNQFWKHKDHGTVFRALREFYEIKGNKEVHLVCTGQMIDYRFPAYTQELKQLIKELGIEKQVHLLGYISKHDQVLLMQQCEAVIQATLFEGGPGGGVVYEALARNKKVVLSDIPVNKEIEDSRCTFFKAGDATDLALKLVQTESKEEPNPNLNQTLKDKQTQALANTIYNAINFVIQTNAR